MKRVLTVLSVLLGLLLTLIFVAPEGLLLALLIGALLLGILYENRHKYYSLLH